MNPSGPVQVVFPPHVGDAIGCLGLALVVLYILAIWLIVDWVMAVVNKPPKGRKK